MLGFIIAFIAGFLTPHAEAPLARPVARALAGVMEIAETELRLLAFMVVMLIAAVLCAVFNTGSVLGVMIAGVLGYFALRIVTAVQTLLENRGR